VTGRPGETPEPVLQCRPDLLTPQSTLIREFLKKPRPFVNRRGYVSRLDPETVQRYRDLNTSLVDRNLISPGQALMLEWFIDNWYRLHPVRRGGYRKLMNKLEQPRT
jgi:hypothetical protein